MRYGGPEKRRVAFDGSDESSGQKAHRCHDANGASRVERVRGVATPGPHRPRAPWSLLLAMALVAAGCDACTYTPQPEPTPDPDPAPVEPADCEAAEDNLRLLGCRAPEGFLLADGFASACERNARDGVHWHPECLAAIDSCGRVDAAWKGVDCP